MRVQLWILLAFVPALAKCESSLQFNKPEVCINYYKQQFLSTWMNPIEADEFMKNPVKSCRVMHENLYEKSCNFYKMSQQCIDACSKGDTKSAEGVLLPFKIICTDMHEDYAAFFDGDDCENSFECFEGEDPSGECKFITRGGQDRNCRTVEESFKLLLGFANRTVERSHVKEACQFVKCSVTYKLPYFSSRCSERAFELRAKTMKKMILFMLDQVTKIDETLNPQPKVCQELIDRPTGEATTSSPAITTSTAENSGNSTCSAWLLWILVIFKAICHNSF